jgi:hypothetical protein
MRYCYTETEKAPVSLEISAEDLREIRKAVDAAATADGSSYRLRRISEDLRRVLREVADQMQRGGRDLAESLDGGISDAASSSPQSPPMRHPFSRWPSASGSGFSSPC